MGDPQARHPQRYGVSSAVLVGLGNTQGSHIVPQQDKMLLKVVRRAWAAWEGSGLCSITVGAGTEPGAGGGAEKVPWM